MHLLPAARPQGRLASGTGPQGHRGRMRARLLAAPGALADYEVLEMLLFLAVPRRDTKPEAKGLINRFGSLRGALTAGRARWAEAGLAPGAGEVLAMVVEAVRHLARAERRETVVLGDWAALERYLTAGALAPGLHALLLDNRNRLVGECRLVDAANPAEPLLRAALAAHASAAMLVRRVVGDAVPSAADEAVFEQCAGAGSVLSVVVHDLVVVGDAGLAGLRRRPLP